MTDFGLGNLNGLTEIEKLMAITEFYFPGKSEALRAVLGTVASLSVIGSRKTIPLWLYGEPGTAKSSVLSIIGGGLNLFDFANINTNYALFISNLSPKSFRSVHIRDDSVDLLDILGADGPRVLVTTELNLLWTKPQQQLDELLGQICKVTDDDPSITYASAGRISGSQTSTSDNFVWLAGTVSLPNKVAERFSNTLGPRLYFFNMKEEAQTPAEISTSLTNMESNSRDFWASQEIVIGAVAAFLQAVSIKPESIEWNKSADEGTAILSDAATMLRVLRAGLTETKKRGRITFRKATFEAPKRARKICTQFARGQAVLRQTNSIGLEDIPLTCKIIFDTAEASYPYRTIIFRKLVANNGRISFEQLAHQIKCTHEFTLEVVDRLIYLGLIQLTGNIVTFTDEYAQIALDLRPYLFPERIQTSEVD